MLVSSFFYNFKQKKKKNLDVLGILIICQHCFTIFNKFASTFSFLRVVSPSTLVSYFFTTSSTKNLKKKKKTNVLGILIICQHCFTFNFFFKNILSIFIHKIFPIIKILLRSNFFHDFILIYLKKKRKK